MHNERNMNVIIWELGCRSQFCIINYIEIDKYIVYTQSNEYECDNKTLLNEILM